MIDSHAHLYFDRFDDDREDVIANARAAGITSVINIGIDPTTSRAAVALAAEHDGFRAAVGVHPTSEVDDLDRALEEIAAIVRDHRQRVVAIGEIGLDFYWKNVAPQEQYPRLHRQLALARELDLPVVFHCRDALAELFEVLEGESELPPGVFHCFSGTPADVERALALDYHVSFAGNVTYPKAKALQRSAAAVPPERLLLETDAPFLAPQPVRGKRNEPAFLVHTRDFLADLHGLDAGELGELAERTTRTLFRMEP